MNMLHTCVMQYYCDLVYFSLNAVGELALRGEESVRQRLQ